MTNDRTKQSNSSAFLRMKQLYLVVKNLGKQMAMQVDYNMMSWELVHLTWPHAAIFHTLQVHYITFSGKNIPKTPLFLTPTST